MSKYRVPDILKHKRLAHNIAQINSSLYANTNIHQKPSENSRHLLRIFQKFAEKIVFQEFKFNHSALFTDNVHDTLTQVSPNVFHGVSPKFSNR